MEQTDCVKRGSLFLNFFCLISGDYHNRVCFHALQGADHALQSCDRAEFFWNVRDRRILGIGRFSCSCDDSTDTGQTLFFHTTGPPLLSYFSLYTKKIRCQHKFCIRCQKNRSIRNLAAVICCRDKCAADFVFVIAEKVWYSKRNGMVGGIAF